MSFRNDLVRVFEGVAPARPVVSIRIDLWHREAADAGWLPAELAGRTTAEIEGLLGFASAARFRGFFDMSFPGLEKSVRREDDAIITSIILPERTLTCVEKRTPEMASAGMQAHTVKHLVRTDDDYRALIHAYGSASIVTDETGYRAYDELVGDAGLPILILGLCPAHLVALKYVGYEQFYLDRVDKPDLVNGLISAIENVYRQQLWPAVAASSAPLVLHGAHFSSAMTPPPIFDELFAPYFGAFNETMHAAGKWVAFHSDADLGVLAPRVAELGFDCADCLATAPLVPEALRDYTDQWKGNVVAWGGLPSVIFDRAYPDAEYRRAVSEAIAFARGRNDTILGASDNVLPGTPWDRLTFLSERIRD